MWNSKLCLLNIVSLRLNFLLEGVFLVRGEQAWQESALGKATGMSIEFPFFLVNSKNGNSSCHIPTRYPLSQLRKFSVCVFF